MSPHSFAQLASPRYGSLLVMLGWWWSSLHVALLSLPSIFTPSLKEFFRLGRAMRVVLLLGNGGVSHLFVIYGYQRAESDPDNLAITDQLLSSLLSEGKVCYSGQPVMLVGDLNVDRHPLTSPKPGRWGLDGCGESLCSGKRCRFCTHLHIPIG